MQLVHFPHTLRRVGENYRTDLGSMHILVKITHQNALYLGKLLCKNMYARQNIHIPNSEYLEKFTKMLDYHEGFVKKITN